MLCVWHIQPTLQVWHAKHTLGHLGVGGVYGTLGFIFICVLVVFKGYLFNKLPILGETSRKDS